MIFFDTHAHMYDKAFDTDRNKILEELNALYYKIVCPSENIETSIKSIELSNKFKNVYAAIGIHPYFAKKSNKTDIETLYKLAKLNKNVVAIGEIGLDYYYNKEDKITQKDFFVRQIELAKELDLPIIIHDRKAHGDILSLIKQLKTSNLRGIMHCFGGSIEFAREMIKLGFYISFAGPIAYENSRKLKEVAKLIPIERILIETDSPYLSPPPCRGQRNNPKNLYYIAKELANLKGVSIEDLVQKTYENSMSIYSLK